MEEKLFFFILEVFQLTSPTHFYFTKAMKNLFKDQPEVNYSIGYNFMSFISFMEVSYHLYLISFKSHFMKMIDYT